MAAGALPVERLREFLRGLAPGARTLLIAELERAVLRGDDVPGGDMLLQEARAAARESGESASRVGIPARLFFRPVEPFLIDAASDRRCPGRLPRSALEPIWNWIARDLVPAEARRFCEEVEHGLATAGEAAALARAQSFQNLAVEQMRAACAAAAQDDRARRRLIAQIATPHALDDVNGVITVLSSRDALELIGSRLPGHVRNLGEGLLEAIKAVLDSPPCAKPGLQPFVLVMVMNRLAAPWQLIRLAVKAAESDDAARIAASSYAAAVNITFAEIERQVDELKADFGKGSLVAITSLLKCIHDAVRGVRTELDLPPDSPWGRRLSAIRSEISGRLTTEIESVPGRVRRLLRPRPSGERRPSFDPTEIAEVEAMIEFVGACRNYAGELAISEITLRTFQDIQQYLDTNTRALLDGLRAPGEADLAFRKAQVDAAIRFCGKAFGRDYAALLTRAAEMAANSEREGRARA